MILYCVLKSIFGIIFILAILASFHVLRNAILLHWMVIPFSKHVKHCILTHVLGASAPTSRNIVNFQLPTKRTSAHNIIFCQDMCCVYWYKRIILTKYRWQNICVASYKISCSSATKVQKLNSV